MGKKQPRRKIKIIQNFNARQRKKNSIYCKGKSSKIVRNAQHKTNRKFKNRKKKRRHNLIERFAHDIVNGKLFTDLPIDYTMNSRHFKYFMVDLNHRVKEILKQKEIQKVIQKDINDEYKKDLETLQEECTDLETLQGDLSKMSL
jgi:hypothetical protein